jgi:hypothetical protein
MPQIRPAEISNRVRLSNELAALDLSFVPERRTVDALLRFPRSFVDAVISE